MLYNFSITEAKLLIDWQSAVDCAFLDKVLPLLTVLGNYSLLWLAVAAIMLFFPAYRRCSLAIFLALLFCLLAGSLCLKPLIDRPRPFEVESTILLLISAPADASFPSGHTMHSVAAATVIFCTNRRLGIAALIVALLIAFSRFYLLVHYPTDILAGMALGFCLGLAAWKSSCVIIHKLGKPCA